LVWFFTDRRSAVRSSLVAALVSCVDRPLKTRARRFLLGLSADELQFIAGFLGCCILESPEDAGSSRAQLARRIAQHQQTRAQPCSRDQEHKMILLLEYLGRSSAAAATAQSRRRPAVPA
jgi:hypothetical protein